MTLGEGRKYLPPELREKLQKIISVALDGKEQVTLSRANIVTVLECSAVQALMHVNLIGQYDKEEYKPYSWLDKPEDCARITS